MRLAAGRDLPVGQRKARPLSERWPALPLAGSQEVQGTRSSTRAQGGAAIAAPFHMQLQFGLLRGELVISDGVEAWILRDGRRERTDALTAFIKSTQLRPREARRTFGDKLPGIASPTSQGTPSWSPAANATGKLLSDAMSCSLHTARPARCRACSRGSPRQAAPRSAHSGTAAASTMSTPSRGRVTSKQS
jgi:hypothetical protein